MKRKALLTLLIATLHNAHAADNQREETANPHKHSMVSPQLNRLRNMARKQTLTPLEEGINFIDHEKKEMNSKTQEGYWAKGMSEEEFNRLISSQSSSQPSTSHQKSTSSSHPEEPIFQKRELPLENEHIYSIADVYNPSSEEFDRLESNQSSTPSTSHQASESPSNTEGPVAPPTTPAEFFSFPHEQSYQNQNFKKTGYSLKKNFLKRRSITPQTSESSCPTHYSNISQQNSTDEVANASYLITAETGASQMQHKRPLTPIPSDPLDTYFTMLSEQSNTDSEDSSQDPSIFDSAQNIILQEQNVRHEAALADKISQASSEAATAMAIKRVARFLLPRHITLTTDKPKLPTIPSPQKLVTAPPKPPRNRAVTPPTSSESAQSLRPLTPPGHRRSKTETSAVLIALKAREERQQKKALQAQCHKLAEEIGTLRINADQAEDEGEDTSEYQARIEEKKAEFDSLLERLRSEEW